MAKNEATLLLRIKEVGGEILDHFVITLGDVINVIGKIPEAVMAAIHAYREEELAVNQLTQSMINQGVFTGELRSEYLKMASALEEVTTYSDDQIIAAEATLQSQLKGIAVSKQLLVATLDLAAGKRIDLASAAELVGKTIGTETNALQRQGIAVADATSAHERMGNVITAIEKKFKGHAETAAKDLGVMDQLKNSWSNFLENMGAILAPFVTGLAKATKSVLDFFNSFAGANIAKMNIGEINQEIIKLRTQMIKIQETAAYKGGLDAGDKSMLESLEKRRQMLIDARSKLVQDEHTAAENKKHVDAERHAEDMAREADRNEERRAAKAALDLAEIADDGIHHESLLQAQSKYLDAQIKAESDAINKSKLIKQKAAIDEQLIEAQKNAAILKHRDAFLSQIAALQSSSNKTLAAIGKAAAIAQIIISTTEAAGHGYKWGMAIGGPPLAYTFQGLAYAAGAAQVAKVSGVALAEGGIVRATPGGIQATIGEGGRDEAVIPLDSPDAQGRLGGGSTIIFNGPVLGDESQAMEFARAIDRSLLKLRQTGQSVAFETDIF